VQCPEVVAEKYYETVKIDPRTDAPTTRALVPLGVTLPTIQRDGVPLAGVIHITSVCDPRTRRHPSLAFIL